MSLFNLPLRAFRKLRRMISPDPNAFLKKCHRILHIGANEGQERDEYLRLGLEVLWVEALPEAFEKLSRNLQGYPNQHAAQALLTDVDDMSYEFNVASNQGASSSIFPFNKHGEIWPDIKYVRTESLQSKRIDTLLSERSIPPGHFDAAILDVQGAELAVLKGFGDHLAGIKFLLCEAADFEAYAGACTSADLEAFLQLQGLKLCRKTAFVSKEGTGTYYDMLFQRPV